MPTPPMRAPLWFAACERVLTGPARDPHGSRGLTGGTIGPSAGRGSSTARCSVDDGHKEAADERMAESSGGRLSLHYGSPQMAIGITFAVLALLLALAFAVIATQAGSAVGAQRVHDLGYWLRKRWLALLLVIGVLVVGVSLFDLPFATGSDAGRTVVKVTGGQFFWSLSPNRVPAGSHVRFEVSSVDVNHGFGLYDPHGHLIGSVQAMPGYHNELDLNLAEAGVYQMRCLELCGLNHSTMESTLTVTRR
jgi:cytochrome c oxidase subunit 2